MLALLSLASAFAAPPVPSAPADLPADGPFLRELLPGLTVAAYEPPEIPDIGYSRPSPEVLGPIDDRLFVVTVDLRHFEVVYASRLQDGAGPSRPADQWARDLGLVVAFNPGMFEPMMQATGYTRAGDFVSQPEVRRNGLYRSFFVVEGGEAQMLDLRPPRGSGRYASMDELDPAVRQRLEAADLVSQSLSILRDGEPAYPPRTSHWSELAYGVNEEGHLVVVFTRRPYEMRELGARIAALQLGITDLLHGEGGPEASLVVAAPGAQLAKMGSYETGFYDDGNRRLWGLPADLGVRPKAP